MLTKPGAVRPLSYAKSKVVNDSMSLGPEDESILRDVMEKRYAHDNGSYGHISRKSTAGAPFFIYNIENKMQALAFVSNNIETVTKYLREGDLKRLYDNFGMLFFVTTQIRRQADKWVDGRPKVREYSNFVDALNGHNSGPLSVDQLMIGSLARPRTRVVNAFSGLANNVMTAVFDGYRSYADSEYAFSYKHTTADAILRKFSKYKYHIGLDVSQFDSTFPYEFMSTWIRLLPLSDVGKRLVRLLTLSPVYTADTHQANGDPLNIADFKYWSGLPSGIFCTSAAGKDRMTFLVVRSLMSLIGSFDVDKFLKGELDVGFLNQGDCGGR